MRHATPLLLASALALAAGSVWAADKDKDATKDRSSAGSTVGNVTRSDDSGFARMDKDKDGYISKVEAKGHKAFSKDFARFDINNDGKLNRAEYLAAAARADVSKAADKVEDKVDPDKDRAASGATTRSTTKQK